MVSSWKGLITEWSKLESIGSYRRSMLLRYEDLVDPATGPSVLHKLAELIRNQGVDVVTPNIDCLWYQIVYRGDPVGNSTASGGGNSNILSQTKRGGHKYKPGYTESQKSQLITMLQDLKSEMSNDEEIQDLTESYIKGIEENIRVIPRSNAR